MNITFNFDEYFGYVDDDGNEFFLTDDYMEDFCNDAFDGMHCVKCNQFNEYISNPNQDNGTYKCYKCRCGF